MENSNPDLTCSQSFIFDVPQQLEQLPEFIMDWGSKSLEYPALDTQSRHKEDKATTGWTYDDSRDILSDGKGHLPLESRQSVDLMYGRCQKPTQLLLPTSNAPSCNTSFSSTNSESSTKSAKRKRTVTSPQISCPVCFTAQCRMRSLKTHYLESCIELALVTYQCPATDCDYVFRYNAHVKHCVVISECEEHWRRSHGHLDHTQTANIINFQYIPDVWPCSICGRAIRDRAAFIEHLYSHNSGHCDIEVEKKPGTIEYTTMQDLLLNYKDQAFSRQINTFLESSPKLAQLWLWHARGENRGGFARPKWVCSAEMKKLKRIIMGRYDQQSVTSTMRRLLELTSDSSQFRVNCCVLPLQFDNVSPYVDDAQVLADDGIKTTSSFDLARGSLFDSHLMEETQSIAYGEGVYPDTTYGSNGDPNYGARGILQSNTNAGQNDTTLICDGGGLTYFHTGSRRGRPRIGEFVPL